MSCWDSGGTGVPKLECSAKSETVCSYAIVYNSIEFFDTCLSGWLIDVGLFLAIPGSTCDQSSVPFSRPFLRNQGMVGHTG